MTRKRAIVYKKQAAAFILLIWAQAGNEKTEK